MNDDNFSSSEAASELLQLDRLVDRQLSEAQRKELLLSLDARPEGWRRCALAFLEAQVWGEEFRAVIREPAAAIESAPKRAAGEAEPARVLPIQGKNAGAPAINYIRWTTLWAMAASFLLAFGGMLYLRGSLQFAGHDAGGNVVATDSPKSSSTDDVSANSAVAAASVPDTIMVAVPDEQGTMQAVQLPLLEVGSADDMAHAAPLDDGDLLPPEVVEAFRRSGREIEQHRQLMPVDLKDGRRAYVPVDQVRIRYVGNREFQ